MIFKPELAAKIPTGEKTQTRRTKKPGQALEIWKGKKAVTLDGKYLKWLVGGIYSIQTGRGKPATGRFRLLDIREEQLQDITESDAKAEGVEPFKTVTGKLLYKPAFASLWNEINGDGAYGNNPTVFALTFEYVG